VEINKKIVLIFSVLVLAAFSFYTTYTIHSSYHLPYHSDEWDHLTMAVEIVKKGSIVNYNPYLSDEYKKDLEVSYHVLLSELILMTGLDPVQFSIIFPAIVSFILSLNAFMLVRFITKSSFAGLLSGMLVTTMKSNVTLLGPWFMVPSAYGMSQLPLMLFVFVKAMGAANSVVAKKPLVRNSLMSMNITPAKTSEKISLINLWDVVLGLLFIQITLAHPPSASILLPVFALYLLMHPRLLYRNRFRILIFCVIAFLLLVNFISFAKLANIKSPLSFMDWLLNDTLVFTDEQYTYHVLYFYPIYLGSAILFLAVLGFYRNMSSDDKSRIIPIALLALLPFVVQYFEFGKSFFAEYRRLFMYNSELIMILAGMGLYLLYAIGKGIIGVYVKNDFLRKIITAGMLVLIAVALKNQADSTFFYSNRLYMIIGENEVGTIQWLGSNTSENSTVLAYPHVSKAITPLSGRRVLALTQTNLGSGKDEIDKANIFFQNDCNVKAGILNELKPDYVFFKGAINCPFLEEVYESKGSRIYKVNP